MSFRRRVRLNVGWAEVNQLAADDVVIGDRTVPSRIDVTMPGVDGQPKLEMVIDSSQGVPRCSDLRISAVEGGRGVRSTDVRAVEIDTWIEAIVPLFTGEVVERGDDGSVTSVHRVMHTDDEEFRHARAVVRRAQRGARRRITDDHLRKVADTYRSDSARPAEAVELAYGVSPRTAFRWIREARDRGFLEPKES